MAKRGCGIIFYNPQKDAVLAFLRDNKDWIPFPNMPDLLGGHVEDGETPEEAAVREMAEELIDLRTGQPYVLKGHTLFCCYIDARDCEQNIFVSDVEVELSDLRLLEGKSLVWVSRQDIEAGLKMAFEFEADLNRFFAQRSKDSEVQRSGLAYWETH